MKKLILGLVCAFASFAVMAQTSTLYLTTSGGNYSTEKWVDITTGPNGTGTVIWAQGDGTYGNGQGLVTDAAITVADGTTFYINCYDRYDDGWDGTTYTLRSAPNGGGILVANNSGDSPNDGADDDTSSSWETRDLERESSEAFTYTPPACSQAAGSAAIGTCDAANGIVIDVTITDIGDGTVNITNDGGLPTQTVTATGTYMVGPFPFGSTVNIVLEHPTDPICNVALSAINIPSGCPPANDDCSGAIALTVNADENCGATTSGSLANATASAEDATACSGTENDDVWFSFVATSTAHTVSLTNIASTPTDLYHSLWEGSCGSLTQIGSCSDPNSSSQSGLTIGNTYYLRVNSWSASAGATTTFDVCIGTPPPPPANDDCSGAIALTVNADENCGTTTSGTLVSATASAEDATACSGTENDDVWFSFVATSTVHTVSLTNIASTPTDLYHSLWEGACGSLTQIGSCSDPNNSSQSGLTIGNTYYLRVNSFSSNSGATTTFDVCIGTPPPPPANDDCSGAIALTVNADENCGTTTSGTLVSATASAEDATACSGTENDDVWFSFVATSTAHTVSLTNIASTPTDLYHSLWEGSCGSLTQIGSCSDSNNSSQSGLTIGNTYYLRVNSFSSNSGATTTFDVCIGTPPPPPANDLCTNAEDAGVVPNNGDCLTINGTTSSATNDGFVPTCDFAGGDYDVFYTFTAPQGGHVLVTRNISVPNAAGALEMVILDACAGTQQGNCGTSLEATGLTPGNVYTLMVWTDDFTNGGNFEICIKAPPPVPDNDLCANATALSNGQTIMQDITSATNTDAPDPCSGGGGSTNNPATPCEGGTGGIDASAGVWYIITSTMPEELTVDLSGSGFDTEVQVFEGTCGALTCIGGDDDGGTGTASKFCWVSTATPGSFAPVNYYVYVDGHGTNTGEVSITLNQAVLPVTLDKFSAKEDGRYNKIEWSTLSEINADHHTVMKAVDGINFTPLTQVDAAIDGTQYNTYEVLDQYPGAVTYYKLMMTDLDGSVEYSPIVSVTRNNDSKSTFFGASPVPTNDNVSLNIYSQDDDRATITVFDISGKVMHTMAQEIGKGNHQINLNLEDYTSGIYMVSIKSNYLNETTRVIRQ